MTAPRGKPNQTDYDDYDSIIIIIIMTKFERKQTNKKHEKCIKEI